jgi:hypothetical protein
MAMTRTAYRYERSSVEFCQEFNKGLFELSVQESSTVKKMITCYGDSSVKNGQCLANEGKKGFRVSKYLQELGCYVGQQLTFDEASENLKRIGGITLSDKQIERICHKYGEELETSLNEDEMTPMDDSLHYAMMDGSMGFIRKQGWKEVKLGRVFADQELIQVKERGWIRASDYVVHLGRRGFLGKV